MSRIARLIGREVLDSRGNPTIEVEITLEDATVGRSSVPSGASIGGYEAIELRDGDIKRYNGKGVRNAVKMVNTVIAPALEGLDVLNQRRIDSILIELDGTPNKSKLGANAIMGTSIACARAGAAFLDIPLFQYIGGIFEATLPVPMMNIINGGLHARNNIDFQEFMIIPAGAPSFSEALRMGSEVYHSLKRILIEKGYSSAVGDEGGFAPHLKNNEEAIKLIMEAIEKAGFVPGKEILLALDLAATSFYRNGRYVLEGEGKTYSTEGLIQLIETLVERYPIISIEDGLAEDDWKGWEMLTSSLSHKVQLVGDDIFVTNPSRLREGIEKRVANAILIKVNQIGTLTETLETVKLAKSSGYRTVISHRSGETEDPVIADISVGVGAEQIKAGAPCRSDRVAKYNQLLRIEEYLASSAIFPGDTIYRGYLQKM